MPKSFTLAVVGATGLVGEELLRLLDERNFPVESVRLFASGDSSEEFVEFGGEELPVQPISSDALLGVDIAFFCAGDAVSREHIPAAKKGGVLCVDLSGAFAGSAPSIVPEVNDPLLEEAYQDGLILSPSPISIALALVLAPLMKLGKIRRVVVSTYEAVSAAGRKGVDILRDEIADLLNGRPVEEGGPFPHQVAFNALPQVGGWGSDGATLQEERVIAEVQGVLQATIPVHLTAVQVPAFFGHGASVSVEFDKPAGLGAVRDALAAAEGIGLADESVEPQYPVPVDAAGQDQVLVGRLRQTAADPLVIQCWLVLDNLRKGGATNALQIAELLAGRYLL